LLTQAVQLFNGRGTIASVQKPGCDVEADQVKANKAVVVALETVAKWVAKLPPPASPTPKVEVLPTRQSARQGTKRRWVQVDADAVDAVDAVEAQILGEIEAIQTIEPMLGRRKRTKISRK
jgi:hypothetical protein